MNTQTDSTHSVVTDLDHHLNALKIERIIAETIGSAILIAVLAVIGYLGYVRNHTGANIALGNEDISFKSRGEVASLVRERTADLTLSFELQNKTIEKKASEIGIVADVERTVDKIFEGDKFTLGGANQAVTEGIKGRTARYEFNVDEARFEEFASLLSSESKVLPKNASIEFKGERFAVVPAEPGLELDQPRLIPLTLAALSELDKSIETPVIKTPAAIGSEVAAAAAEQGEKMISRPVVLKVDGSTYRPTKSEMAQWVDFKPENDRYRVYIDRVIVGGYLINTVGAKHNDAYREVNTDLGTEQIASLIENGKNIEIEVPFISKLSRPPQPWSRYVEVNLSKQHFYAINNGRVELDSPAATGRRANPTPTGTFNINRRLRFRTMTGGDPPNTFPLNVPHVQYFTNLGHAIHGANWHNQFGYFSYRGPYGRSHGCVNLPLSAAEKFWNWNSSLGLPVWIHY